jgi:GT2 family glycosyltransferase
MEQNKISVIIPVYEGGEDFQFCLKTLLAAKPPAEEIIVVSDGDKTGCADFAESLKVKVLRNSTTCGPAQARNLGASIAQGDILLFIDADVLVKESTIEEVRKLFEDKTITAIFGSYDDQPKCKNFLSQYRNLLHHYVHQNAKREATTFWTGCGAVRKDAFVQINGFSNSYNIPAMEDIELGYRLKKAGGNIVLEKNLQVKHLKHWGIISLLKTDFFRRALPWTKLILQKKVIDNDLNLKYSSRISVVLVYILILTFLPVFLNIYILVITLICAVLLIILNKDIYLFFLKKRGYSFMLGTIFWHWVYYFYSGLGFLIGTIQHFVTFRKNRAICV